MVGKAKRKEGSEELVIYPPKIRGENLYPHLY